MELEINDHVCSREQGKGRVPAIAHWHSKDNWILQHSQKSRVQKCVFLVTAVLEFFPLFCFCFQLDKDDWVLSIQFRWNGLVRPVGSTFIGVSPEVEFVHYTVIFLLAEERATCETVKIEVYELQMVVCCHGHHIGTAYLVLLSTPQWRLVVRVSRKVFFCQGGHGTRRQNKLMCCFTWLIFSRKWMTHSLSVCSGVFHQ